MNDDAFEKKLRELTRAVQRPDSTPAWKADILARAWREADAAPHECMSPPRWFMAALGVAWAAILVMNFTTPHDAQSGGMREVSVSKKMLAPDALSHSASWTLLAYQQRMNLNLELPQ
jgi:hypothetical protein